MTLPQLMFRIWDGDETEYFRWTDMQRLKYNVTIMARELEVPMITLLDTDRASQFRYDEALKLEQFTETLATAAGVTVTISTDWHTMKALSYADFERWELNLWTVYHAMGGIGDRVSDKEVVVIVQATLWPDKWTGNPPYIDLDVPMVHDSAEAYAFVPHLATVEQRYAEYRAALVASVPSDRVVRITANGIKPKTAIPIRIARGALKMIETKTLTSAGWTGTGPWTQSVTLTGSPEEAVIGMPSGMTQAQSDAYSTANVHASAISGHVVTVRAIYAKPTIDIPIGIYYSESDVIRWLRLSQE